MGNAGRGKRRVSGVPWANGIVPAQHCAVLSFVAGFPYKKRLTEKGNIRIISYVADLQPRIYNLIIQFPTTGEMTERLKVHAWKACVRETVPRVRIPLSPPFQNVRRIAAFFF